MVNAGLEAAKTSLAKLKSDVGAAADQAAVNTFYVDYVAKDTASNIHIWDATDLSSLSTALKTKISELDKMLKKYNETI